jgi:hypothetical protein
VGDAVTELVPNCRLSCDTNRVYGLVNVGAKVQHRAVRPSDPVRRVLMIQRIGVLDGVEGRTFSEIVLLRMTAPRYKLNSGEHL